jgi:pyruvate dehydrogenase E2 component (dihydrolipoamide acetyltransferase)
MTTVTMPQLGETIVEGTILTWLKKEGDTVALDEPLFEISTDKVDTEVPSPAAGVLAKILVPEGQTVAVKTPLAEIEEAAVGAEATAISAPAPTAARISAPAPTPPTPSTPSVPTLPDRGPRSRVLSPLVRRLAQEHDVDLAQVVGSGTGGRITKTDVLAFVASRTGAAPAAVPEPAVATGPAPAEPAAAPAPVAVPQPAPVALPAPSAPPTPVAPPAPVGAGEEAVPISHIRKLIAEHMTRSLQVSARAWNAVEVNMENVARLRERAKEAFRAREGFNLTYMPFVSRAVTDALLTYPMVNAEMRGDEMVLKRYVNLGIAVSYEEGLIVPAVKGAESMNVVGLARAINDVATRARAKKLKPDEVHGGTFTITNPGPFGSLISVPIINQPETAILAFDTVEKRPVVVDDAIAIRHMVYLSLSWDHRVIDGALASQFLVRVKQNLETWDFSGELGL